MSNIAVLILMYIKLIFCTDILTSFVYLNMHKAKMRLKKYLIL